MAKKITKKEASTGAKLRQEEELIEGQRVQEDLKNQKAKESLQVAKKLSKAAKEEETKGGNIFSQAEDSQSALKKEKRMAEIKAKLD